jgi:hypothetical protein
MLLPSPKTELLDDGIFHDLPRLGQLGEGHVLCTFCVAIQSVEQSRHGIISRLTLIIIGILDQRRVALS